MAQAELISMPRGTMAGGSFTAAELHEVQECERLVRFRDEVLSGNHPRIKPAHLTAKTVSTDLRSTSANALTSSAVSPPASTKTQAGATGNRQTAVNPEQSTHSNVPVPQTALQSFSVNPSQPVPGLGKGTSSLPNGGTAVGSSARPFVPTGSTEINPVLLEKSADLVKAEMSLKRQRLERSLRDEMDQRRVSAKATLQPSEPLPGLDVTAVLSKAQALVKPISPPPTDDTAANASASSDSFDDNTFYSSQHDTPEFLEEESRAPNKSPEDIDMREESPYEPQFEAEPAVQTTLSQIAEPNIPNPVNLNAQAIQNTIPPTNIPTGPRAERMNGIEPYHNLPPRIPGLQTVQPLEGRNSQHLAAETSYSAETSVAGGQKPVTKPQLSSVNNAPLGEPFARQPSPLIRAHNLSPIAPQPAHVSPLAVARQPPAAQIDDGVRTGTPAQVAALRKQPSAASSPDSSPRDSGATEKRQKKKKKRKSERLVATEATAASPRIKAEPRSPSPIAAPSYARPNKRLRQEQRQPGGLGYDEARYDQPPRPEDGYTPRYEQRRTYIEERYPLSQQPQFAEDLRPREAPPPVMGSDSRYEREYYEPARPTPAAVYRPASPGSAFPGHYVPGQVRQVRSVSHAVLERPYRDGPVPIQYSGPREGRMSVRPAVDRERSRSPVAYERHASVMPPPRAPVRRIIVDEYGREYIEPPRPAVVRASVAPGARLDEPEVIYERTVPSRAVSRRPEIYEDASLYRQSAPYFPPANAPYARRVVTQPELTGPDYRAYRERDYAPRPVTRHPDEMLPPGAERLAEVPREYVARAASVRPARDGYQYDLPAGYQRRIVEEVPREYASARAGSVRPVDGQRYEVRHGYERVGEYGAVPARTASLRPAAEPMQYGEVVRDPGWRVGSVRPDVREYAPSALPEIHREMLPPAAPPRAYSVRPGEATSPVYQQPALRPTDAYYGHGQAPGRGDEAVTYVDQVPRQDAYGAPRRH
jgi:hypothetical protein